MHKGCKTHACYMSVPGIALQSNLRWATPRNLHWPDLSLHLICRCRLRVSFAERHIVRPFGGVLDFTSNYLSPFDLGLCFPEVKISNRNQNLVLAKHWLGARVVVPCQIPIATFGAEAPALYASPQLLLFLGCRHWVCHAREGQCCILAAGPLRHFHPVRVGCWEAILILQCIPQGLKACRRLLVWGRSCKAGDGCMHVSRPLCYKEHVCAACWGLCPASPRC